MNELVINPAHRKLVPPEVAWHYKVLPAALNDGLLRLYAVDRADLVAVAVELEVVLGSRIEFIPASLEAMEPALTGYCRKVKEENGGSKLMHFRVQERDSISSLLDEARSLNSSDIHIEVYEQQCRVRFRIDGKLVERLQVNKEEYPALVNKVKIMSGLDISEKRLPQDGRIFYKTTTSKFDIRVSVVPTLYGEKIVLRILGGDAGNIELDQLGFSEADLKRFRESIRKPSGIILISGPTGSGKTTTLYATLRLLNKESLNIITIEDPIEYTLEGVNQVQVKEDIGLTFSDALRSFLRQDPDIIMVGEIRDTETANLAIRAALTGHLVLSTIHTNSAWGTISRLTDMNVPSFLVANTLVSTIAQRLIRLLCTSCKRVEEVDRAIFPGSFKKSQLITSHCVPVGCSKCYYTGYAGRKAIYEVIPIDSTSEEFILNQSNEVTSYLKSIDVKTLQDSALALLINGETSVEEIYPYLLDDQY